MKRLLCLMLLLALLAGCAGPGETTPTTLPTEGTVPVETTEPVPALRRSANAWKGVEELLQLELPFEEVTPGATIMPAMLGENLLLWQHIYNEEGYTAAIQFWLVDVTTGQVLAEYCHPFQEWGEYVQVLSDRLCICDNNQRTVTILGEDLQILRQWTMGEDWQQTFAGEGDALYFLSEAGLLARDMTTGEERLLLEAETGVFIGNMTGEGAVLNYWQSQTSRWMVTYLNFATGELEDPPFRGSFSSAYRQGDQWLCNRSVDYTSIRAGNGTRAWDMTVNSGVISLLNDGALLHTNGLRLSLYAMDGTHLAACDMPENQRYYGTVNPFWMDALGGYVFENYDDEQGCSNILLWVPEQESGEALNAVEADLTLTEAQELAQLTEQAAALGEQYGIEILVGYECRTDYDDHTVELQTDPDVIRCELRRLERILASFPEGFFPQLYHEDYQRIQINLIRNLMAKPHYGTGGSYDGVVYTSPDFGGFLMAIDTDSADDTLYYHELSHIIEDFVGWSCGRNVDEMYFSSGWNSRNPEGFTYTYDKTHYIDLIEEYAPYFIDNYALINEKEDRSRIFEYACTNAGEWIFPDKPGALEKMRFYAEAIRLAFDTTGWPEVTVWEQYLQ